MKRPSNKSTLQSAFSLVELLVVIAVIAVIAAIAIPNIAGITSNAQSTSDMRNAQNLASLASAAIAAGADKAAMGADEAAVIANLVSTTGISVTNAGKVFGPFRADGVTTDATALARITRYLSYDSVTGALIYTQTAASSSGF